MIKYSKQHEWIKKVGDSYHVGITEYAQEKLGDIVFVELPEVGSKIKQGSQVAVVESVKAASEVYSPISGEIVDINKGLEGAPELVNSSAESDGWFFAIDNIDEEEMEGLMDEDEYKEFIA
jgi:glycine cleavage system H protein